MADSSQEADLRCQVDQLQQRVAELEATLAQQDVKLNALTDSAPVGLFLDDAKGNAIYINKKCAELIGVPAERALEFNWVPFLHPDDRELMVSTWEEAFKHNKDFRLEYRWVHADGTIVWTLGQVIPMLDENGDVLLYVGTLTDITARKQAEREKEDLQAQLFQAQKMESIGRLAGGVAHDYNNMLNVILACTEIAMSEVGESAPVYERLKQVLKAATRSAGVTRQLLSFARKQMVLPEVLDLNVAVTDIREMLNHLLGENIEFVCQTRPGEIAVRVDRSQLDQILVNLCINARDAVHGQGRIDIQTATVALDKADCVKHPQAVPGDYAVLSVSDDGCGMDEETLAKVFEPFFSTKHPTDGTGLGLASVHGATEQNQGFVTVESQLGAGTTFKVHLPLHQGSIPATKTPEPEGEPKGNGETVLVVEDEDGLLQVMEWALEQANYKVLAAAKASEALDLAEHHQGAIDLLVTDVVMPDMNGQLLVKELRGLRPQLECLFISGYTADVVVRQGVLEEHDNFLHKPFRIRDLVAKTHELIAGSQDDGAPPPA